MTTEPTSLVDHIGHTIGTTATMRLIAIFGGARLYVPETMPADHPIARAIGHPAALKLAQVFGKERLDIPPGNDFLRLTRIRRVAALLRAGAGRRDIATGIGCTEKQVMNYRTEAEEIGMLPMVFDGKSGQGDEESADAL